MEKSISDSGLVDISWFGVGDIERVVVAVGVGFLFKVLVERNNVCY